MTGFAGHPQSVQPARMPEEVAVFAVRRDAQSLSIDPVVIVHYGVDQRFKTIPSLDPPIPWQNWTNADLDRVEKAFYKPGSGVSVFSGGEKLGTATVRSSKIEGRDGGCVDLSAVVSYRAATPPLLATNTMVEIPGHGSKRRPATSAETALIRQLARQWLIDHGLDKPLLQQGAMGPVTSTELRKDGGRALIGRFDVKSEHAIHRLFAIAEQGGARYHLTLANLEIQHDEDGSDKTEREYLDQLDINNDGLDEVVSSATHFESWSYTIWQFDGRHGVWQERYTGGGGGC
jgi:hypothetical protein